MARVSLTQGHGLRALEREGMIGSNTSGGGFNDLFLFTFYLQK